MEEPCFSGNRKISEVLVDSEVLPALTFAENAAASATPVSDEERNKMPCLKCDYFAIFPAGKDEYLTHLYNTHCFVIAEVNDIPLLNEYVQFWQQEFKEQPFEEYCTTLLLDQLPDGTPAKHHRYYLLADVLPKDFEIRARLRQKKLEIVLAQHQFERTDRNFSRQCLFCRTKITGPRSEFLEHLFKKHFLQLGKPENLVYIDELIDQVQQTLEDSACIFCGGIFTDRAMLKEHMRKKGHKRINPVDRNYDKFFLVNYRGESRKDLYGPSIVRTLPHKKKTRDESIDLEERFGSNESSDSDWSDWEEEEVQQLNCLYCKHQDASFEILKEHMKEKHRLDFDASIRELNFYQRIKVINYVRRQVRLQRCVICNTRCESLELLEEHTMRTQHFGFGTEKEWDKPEYFFPTYEDDGVLCLLDDNPNDNIHDSVVPIISEDTVAQINKEAERLSLENFKF